MAGGIDHPWAIFDIFISILGPGTYFITILDPVASFSQSFSPFELTATHFGPQTIIFGRPQNTNVCYQTLKILIFASVCIANREICIADTDICLKDTNYMWQIQISTS